MKTSQRCRLLQAEVDFAAWLARSRSGDAIEYHRGFLALDRNNAHSTLAADLRRQVNAIADAAYDAAEAGLVHLVQSRIELHRFCYLAVRRDTEVEERVPRYVKHPARSPAAPSRLSSRLALSRSEDLAGLDPAVDLQIRHVRSRYAISMQRAAVIAEHAYNAGRHS